MTQTEFLHDVADPDNHRPLLWLALEATKDSFDPVYEYGAGNGSTKYLRKYCQDDVRELWSYDNNLEWAIQHKSIFTSSWMYDHLYRKCSVALVDQAPGEFRKYSIEQLKDKATIIVIHDAEPDESMGYELHTIWHLFKYRVFVKGKKIWTAALSNHYDLTKHVGETIGDFTVSL